ncbi:hypothetical protein Tco_0271875 [Tanacetum coccineum]
MVIGMAHGLRWSQDKLIEMVNIIGNTGARLLTRSMAKELGVASAHECLFIDFLSEEEPKIYQANPKESHLIVVKRIFRKSTSGACQLLGGKLVCRSAKKQQYVAISLAEDKYVAAARCYANILWMKSQLTDYDIIYEKVSTPTGGIRGDIGIDTFRNALRAHYLPHSSMYVSPPSITIVRPWFATIGYSGEIGAKGTLKKSCLPPRKRNSVQFGQGQKPKPSFTSHTSGGEMHKEAQQAAGGSTSLGATSEEGVHPQLSSGTNPSILVDQTKSAKDGLKTAHTDSGINKESRADDISNKIKLEDLSELFKDTRSAIFTPDSPQDEPIFVSDESEEEEEVTKDKDTHASFHDVPEDTSILHPPSPKLTQIQELMAQARPSYQDINQLTDLLVTSLKLEFSKLLASHDFARCLPNALKELPSKFTDLSGEIKALKKHAQDMKIELSGDLKEIPTKLETFTFTSTISSLSS